ncbi:MAG: BON domain-containing protein [Myxococcales bacterium]
MRSLGLLAITCGGLLLSACAHTKAKKAESAEQARKAALAHEDLPLNPPQAAYVIDDEEFMELPAPQIRRETASASGELIEPSHRKSAASQPTARRGKREMPGTGRTNAAPIFARSTIPLSKYNLEQGSTQEALEAKERILTAMASTAELPNGGAAITVVTQGDKAILFGNMPSAVDRKLVEDIAQENARRVESHIRIVPAQ